MIPMILHLDQTISIIKPLNIYRILPWKFCFTFFNNIWDTGTFPDSWKEATIIQVAKPGKDDTNPSNYRPIALTSCVCKTLERMINERLVWYLESS